MKTNENMQKDAQEAINRMPLFGVAKIGIAVKVGRHLKKIIFLTSLVGMGLIFNACSVGYVATEPAYVEYSRPQQPSKLHVWIDGDWVYSSQTHTYAQKHGRWERPNQGRTYVSGHWQSTPRGKYWVAGSWQRQGRQVDRYNR